MTDDELTRLLRRGEVPDRPAEYWQTFPEQVRFALGRTRNQKSIPVTPRRTPGWPRVGYALGLISAILVIVFYLGPRRHLDAPGWNDPAQATALLKEVSLMFPNQVEAIVFDHGASQLILAEHATVPEGTPVFLTVCEQKHCRNVITRSGQQLRINGERCDVLVDAKGGVILAGQRFVWFANKSTLPDRDVRVLAYAMPEIL